jgi:hypothetical protein
MRVNNNALNNVFFPVLANSRMAQISITDGEA